MSTIPGFPKHTEESALMAAKAKGHRFTDAPHVSQSGEDNRRSWRCLDCDSLLIVYHQIRGYHEAKCLGADGSALTRFCKEKS